MQVPLPEVWAVVTMSGPRTASLPLTLSKRDSHPRMSLVLLVNHSLCWKALGETSGSFYTGMSPQVPPALEYHLSHTFLLPLPWLDTGPCAHLPPDKPTFSTTCTSRIEMRWFLCSPAGLCTVQHRYGWRTWDPQVSCTRTLNSLRHIRISQNKARYFGCRQVLPA